MESYDRLAQETGRPCYSITFWRTVDGRWGAQAGLGDNAFGDTVEAAIEASVDNAVATQAERRAEASGPRRRELTSPKSENPAQTRATTETEESKRPATEDAQRAAVDRSIRVAYGALSRIARLDELSARHRDEVTAHAVEQEALSPENSTDRVIAIAALRELEVIASNSLVQFVESLEAEKAPSRRR